MPVQHSTDGPKEWKELFERMKFLWNSDSQEWTQTTEAMFYDQLEVVPPERMKLNIFLVGEPWDHTSDGQAIHSCFWYVKTIDQYYARYMTIKDFDTFTRESHGL